MKTRDGVFAIRIAAMAAPKRKTRKKLRKLLEDGVKRRIVGRMLADRMAATGEFGDGELFDKIIAALPKILEFIMAILAII